MRFSALSGLHCNHATCLGKRAYHAAVIIALRRLHRQRTTSNHKPAFGNKPLRQGGALASSVTKRGRAQLIVCRPHSWFIKVYRPAMGKVL